MPSINLLPWRAELRKRRQTEFLIGLAGAIGLAVVITLTSNLAVHTMIEAQQHRKLVRVARRAGLDDDVRVGPLAGP